LFTRLQGPVSLAFLETFPTPEASQAISREELVAFLKKHRCSNMKRVSEIHQRLQEITPNARVSTGYVCHVQALVGVLKTLHQQLTRLKKQIETVLDSHPEADWWRQFPGVGTLTAAQLLAHFGDNRDQFPSYEILQATAGTVPITRRSGKKRTVQFRRACSHTLRDTTMNMARNSIRKSGWAKSYYRDQLAAGHSQSRAYRALANRWLKIIWTLWQRREYYDEAHHVANRSRQGQRAKIIESICPIQVTTVSL
jgi:transposase